MHGVLKKSTTTYLLLIQILISWFKFLKNAIKILIIYGKLKKRHHIKI